MRDGKLIERAKAMRRELTGPELKQWLELRAKCFEGAKFRRQVVIGRYIADFACRNPMLIVEVDGETHVDRGAADQQRTEFLQDRGYRVIRFTNADVSSNLGWRASSYRWGASGLPLSLALSPEGERGSTSFELTWLRAITQRPSTLRISLVLIPSCGRSPPSRR